MMKKKIIRGILLGALTYTLFTTHCSTISKSYSESVETEKNKHKIDKIILENRINLQEKNIDYVTLNDIKSESVENSQEQKLMKDSNAAYLVDLYSENKDGKINPYEIRTWKQLFEESNQDRIYLVNFGSPNLKKFRVGTVIPCPTLDSAITCFKQRLEYEGGEILEVEIDKIIKSWGTFPLWENNTMTVGFRQQKNYNPPTKMILDRKLKLIKEDFEPLLTEEDFSSTYKGDYYSKW